MAICGSLMHGFQWKSLGEPDRFGGSLAIGWRNYRTLLSIEQQQQSLSSRVALARSRYGIDLWSWLRMDGAPDFYLFDAQARRVNFLPMADGAVYSVSLAPTGLLATPLNQAAEEALRNWK